MRPPRPAILSAVSQETGVSQRALVGPNTNRSVCAARHVGMASAWFLGYTYQEAASMFGRSNHATALKAWRKVTNDEVLNGLCSRVIAPFLKGGLS